MRRISPFAALALGLTVAACVPAETDTAMVGQELTDQMAAFREAILSGEADRSIGFFTTDAHILEAGVNVAGDEVGDFFREIFETSRILSFDIEAYDQFVHGDVAYEVGEYDETVEVEGEEETVQNYYFLRWEKGTDGAWRIDRVVTGPREAPSGM